MKRTFKLAIPLIAAAVMCLTFTRCIKDDGHVCTMRIKCYLSQTGIDTGRAASYAQIVVGKEGYAAFARDSSFTDKNGVYEHDFRYPALLDVKALCADTILTDIVTGDTTIVDTVIDWYTGATQVQIAEDEVAEKSILLVKSNN